MHLINKVLKFGGSSVGTPERIQNVIEIVKKEHNLCSQIAVVVSAFSGVTDLLIAMGKKAAQGEDWRSMHAEASERHLQSVHHLIPQSNRESATKEIGDLLASLHKILEGIALIKELSPKTCDHLMSFGERLSALIISKAIQPSIPDSYFIDARELIATDGSFGSAQVDFNITNSAIKKYFLQRSGVPIITGFIGSSKHNETTTLGRGGSDYTAAIVGAALHANVIEIWTDVDGVMTADPQKEKYAFPLAEMSYKEAMEMSYFGAKVIHPPTIAPALEKKIPLKIKNTFNPEAQGTLISSHPAKSSSPICGISSIDHAALLCLQGAGLVGVCGIAKRLFSALAEKKINIILISQGSSEHSICFAIAPATVESAKEAIEKEFELEMRAHIIDALSIDKELSVIAVVGENMCKTSGIAGILFSALGKNGINVTAIAQGSSELNISVVVKRADEIKAINAIHEAFFLSPRTTLNLFLVGTGLIGGTILQELEKNHRSLRENLDIRLIGIANSRKMVFNSKGIPLGQWRSALDQSEETMDPSLFRNRMQSCNLINSVFVDCTANQSVADLYESILNSNIAIVTPNKKANSGPYQAYKRLKDISVNKGVKFLYGSNVGAGLPIISTLNELLSNGDKILKIEAVLSGTLSYIFNAFVENSRFSDILKEAQAKGLTEPDPREDLNAMDMARKLLILARECGYEAEMDDIAVESILPEECFHASSLDAFYSQLKKQDERLSAMRKEAQQKHQRLRCIAAFEGGRGRIALTGIGPDHPFYHLSGCDNIVAITSEFYRENPLVIKGQGAGAAVTAGKVLGDIVRLREGRSPWKK